MKVEQKVIQPLNEDDIRALLAVCDSAGSPPLVNMYINRYQQTLDDGSPNPFLDLRVRQAANYAINRQAFIDNLLLGQGQQSMFAFHGTIGYPTAEQKQEVDFDYDPERAKQLLAEAGYADGFDIPVYWPAGWGPAYLSDIVLAVAQDLAAVGIRAEPESVPVSEYFTDAYTRGRENTPPGLFLFGAAPFPDVATMWECCTSSEGFFSLGPVDPSLEELYQALKVEPDPERRTEMVTELLLEHKRGAYFLFILDMPSAGLTVADVNWPLGGPFGLFEGFATWHRTAWRRSWARRSRRRPGRPRISARTRALIQQMARENPTWGATEIVGALQLLEISVSRTTVRRYRREAFRRSPSPRGRTFLRLHAPHIWATDLFTVQTLTFRTFYVLLVVSHDRRRIEHGNVTRHPTAVWIWRQILEATSWGKRPRYLIRDRDASDGRDFVARAARLGIQTIITPVRAPQANAIAERCIGTVRRECLDHLIVINERHLRAVLREYVAYYNGHRPHRSLGLEPPDGPRPIPAERRRVVSRPILGGLHHVYQWAA